MNSNRSIYCCCVVLACIWPGLALAQGSPNAEAAQHFERGLALAKQKAYPDAIAEFNRAYQISPHFSVMYNLGQAYIAADQPAYAVEALRRYLAEGGAEVPNARRQQVEDTILVLERRIGVTVPAAPPAPAASAPVVAPVAATAALPAAQPVPPFAGTPPPSAPAVSSTPQTPPAAAASADGTPLVTPPVPRRSRARIATAIILGVVGAGGIATGSVFGLRAFSKKCDSDKECPSERCTDRGVSLNNEAKDAATVSTVTFGVGIVAAAAATYLLIKPGSSAASPPGTPVSTLELVPEVGSREGRLTLRGVW